VRKIKLTAAAPYFLLRKEMMITRSMAKRIARIVEQQDTELEDCLMGEHTYDKRECHTDCPYNTDKWIECGDCGHDHHPDYCLGADCACSISTHK
jgi:hypothetical protein